jgi:hypothetical protein
VIIFTGVMMNPNVYDVKAHIIGWIVDEIHFRHPEEFPYGIFDKIHHDSFGYIDNMVAGLSGEVMAQFHK